MGAGGVSWRRFRMATTCREPLAQEFDLDVLVIGAGYGGFDAAKHAAEHGLRSAIVEARELGGTCVNRGCVPSKALLAASGRVRELNDQARLARLGIHSGGVRAERQPMADHARKLVDTMRASMGKTLQRLGVQVLEGRGRLRGPHGVVVRSARGIEREITAAHVIVATGSEPFVPRGIMLDGHTVFTSDEALTLSWLPPWIAIVGSGYIGLEFADIYTALGCEVTLVEALDQLMPSFDADIRKLATRHLIEARDIETYTGVLASKVTPGSPVKVELRHAASKELVDTLEVDGVLVATGRAPVSQDLNLASVGVATERGFIPVDERLRVLADGQPVEGLWAVGDVTGKLMLAHAAAAQGIVAVENILGHGRTMDYRSIPAVTFTHPEISSVGLTQEEAQEEGRRQGFELGSVRSYFRANAKALAEAEGDGLMKLLFRRDNGRVLGAQIYGLHAGDLIQEVANAMVAGQSVQQLSQAVHTHPTLSEVVEVAYKQAAAALPS